MLDRIIQELVASFCSWRVDMGMIPPPDSTPVNQSTHPAATRRVSSATMQNKNNNINTTNSNNHPHPQPSIEDPEYFQRIMQSRYPEHMLHCPQTSLYPIFFFLMERWEARREAAKQNVLSTTTTATTDSQQND